MSIKYRNFYSRDTCISISLPEDWAENESDMFAVLYSGTSTTQYNPVLGIAGIPIPNIKPDTYRQVANATIEETRSLPSYKQISLTDLMVGKQPALNYSYSWRDKEVGMTAIQQQVFVQIVEYVFIFTCTTNGTLAPKHLPIFDHALKSVRFIDTGT